MAELVNLGRAKKQAARKAARARGDENAARFGRTRAERENDEAQAKKARKDLDGHRREPE